MSFSTDVRRELARVTCEKKCCAEAELVGAVLASGGLSFKGLGRYGLIAYADSAETAQRYLALFKRFFHCECELSALETSRLGGLTRYAVAPPEEAVPGLLKALRLLDKRQAFGLRSVPAPEALRDDCCRRAFLRGVFLAGGSTGNPQRAYHIEIAVADEALGQCVLEVLKGYGLPAKRIKRKTQQVVYIKDAEHMAEALTLLGAHQALLQLENLRIVKDLRNGVNRQTNCDNANVDKVVAASERQVSMIRVIEKKLGLGALTPPLYDIADLRLKYPDATLSELGNMATPKLGKSGVSARMRKLETLAEELANE